VRKKRKRGLPTAEVEVYDFRGLSAAVRRVRDAHGLTQEAFAQRIGTAAMTISHFETGRYAPRDPLILTSLEKAAEHVNLHSEAALFKNAAIPAMKKRVMPAYYAPYHSLQETNLMLALRLTFEHFREDVPAVEKALAQALRIVNEVRESRANRRDYGALNFLVLEKEASDYVRRTRRQGPQPKRGKDQSK